MRVFVRSGILLGALAIAAPASAGFYECRDKDGNIGFQDHPCAAGLESREREQAARGISRAVVQEPDDAVPAALAEAPERPLVTVIAAPVRVPANQRFLIHAEPNASDEWDEALAQARSNHRHGTLVRIWLEDATPDDLIQATATKLSNPSSRAGGGRYQEFPSGTFVLLEHVGSSATAGRESLEVGHKDHGLSKVWLPVATRDTVAIGGDLVIGRMATSQRGDLWLHLPAGYRKGPVAIGPLIVGGRYGEQFPCDANGTCKISGLSPGAYKVQFPELDERRARFDVEVAAGHRLEVDLRPGGPKFLQIVDLRTQPISR